MTLSNESEKASFEALCKEGRIPLVTQGVKRPNPYPSARPYRCFAAGCRLILLAIGRTDKLLSSAIKAEQNSAYGTMHCPVRSGGRGFIVLISQICDNFIYNHDDRVQVNISTLTLILQSNER